MARLLLLAASAALFASSASAAVLVVRSSGPSAAAYPAGKALPDSHVLKLKASDTIVLLDSRGTRTLSGPGNFSVSASATPTAVGRTADYLVAARAVRAGKTKTAAVAKAEGLEPYFLDRWVKFIDPANATKAPAARPPPIWRWTAPRSTRLRISATPTPRPA